MILLKVFQEKLSVLLVALVSLFFVLPAFNDIHPIVPISPFVFLIVLFLLIRIANLRMKIFWYSILFIVIGFFLDLILAFTTATVLERVLTVVVHGVYASALAVSIGMIMKKLTTEEDDTLEVIKSGICGYLLIGLLWAVFFSFAYWVYRPNLSVYEAGQIPFFYFSYSVLTSLKFSGVFPVTTWAVSLAYLEVIFGQIFLILFMARLAAVFIKKQKLFR